MKTFNFVDIFTDMPGGRYPTDGSYNGETFREEHLLPLLAEHGEITIDLTGIYGAGSSFLEEAFGGIVRHGYYTSEQLKSKLHITGCDYTAETISKLIDEGQEIYNYNLTKKE